MNIEKEFIKRKNNTSDINEHLETLFNYGVKSNHITEFGSRFGDSTVALIHSKPKKMISYDLFKSDFIKELNEENYSFVLSDTLQVNIEETDFRKWRKGLNYKDSVSFNKDLGGGVINELSHELID